jgi:single-strand DNA-binding protein
MADLNSCNFTGRLTRDAEKKTLPTGTDLVTFDVANNTGWGDYKKTIYLTVNLWGKSGTGVFPYLKKGKQVALSGALEVQRWTSNQDGQEKQKNVLNCRDCILLADSAMQADSATKNPPPAYDDYEDDIPY